MVINIKFFYWIWFIGHTTLLLRIEQEDQYQPVDLEGLQIEDLADALDRGKAAAPATAPEENEGGIILDEAVEGEAGIALEENVAPIVAVESDEAMAPPLDIMEKEEPPASVARVAVLFEGVKKNRDYFRTGSCHCRDRSRLKLYASRKGIWCYIQIGESIA